MAQWRECSDLAPPLPPPDAPPEAQRSASSMPSLPVKKLLRGMSSLVHRQTGEAQEAERGERAGLPGL